MAKQSWRERYTDDDEFIDGAVAKFEQIIADTERGVYVRDSACESNKTALDIVREIEESGESVGLFSYPGGFRQFKKDAEAGLI